MTYKEDAARPFSIRLTATEKTALTNRAGGTPLGTFVRSIILDPRQTPQSSKRKYSIKDDQALGQLLGLLGQSRIANNLNQLAKAAHIGALPILKETESDLRAACSAVIEMRRLLLAALGIAILDGIDAPKPLSSTFADRADGDR